MRNYTGPPTDRTAQHNKLAEILATMPRENHPKYVICDDRAEVDAANKREE